MHLLGIDLSLFGHLIGSLELAFRSKRPLPGIVCESCRGTPSVHHPHLF